MSKSEEAPSRLAYSPREAGALLGRDRCSVYNWLKTGELRSIAVSGRIMISARELERFVNTTTGKKAKNRKPGSGRPKAKRREVSA